MASTRKMPGPRLPASVQSLLSYWLPIEYADWLRRRYGPVVYFKHLLFGQIAYVSDPRMVAEIFKADAGLMHAGEANAIMEQWAGPNSILLLDEKRHLSMRKLIMPLFHGDATERFGDLIERATLAEIERWPIGKRFPTRPSMGAITLEVILWAVFGAQEPQRLNELRRALPEVAGLSLLLVPSWAQIDLGPHSPWGRFVRARAQLYEIISAEIARRRKYVGRQHGEDLLSLLIAARDRNGLPLSDAELRDQLVTVLMTGYETSASALAWVFERLSRHPVALERLTKEIADGDESYLEAVIKETLRIRPTLIHVGRKLTQSFELGGYTIPKGTVVMPAIGAIHYNDDLYDDPKVFRPERFLKAHAAANSWTPFGGGVRRCPGANFAQFEMKVVLKTVLEHVELCTTSNRSERAKFRNITMVPAKGGEIRLLRRLNGCREKESSLSRRACAPCLG